MLTKTKTWLGIARNKWFILACCFLVVNIYGVSRRPVRDNPGAVDRAEHAVSNAAVEVPAETPDAEPAAAELGPAVPKPLTIAGIQSQSPSFGDPWIRVRLSDRVDAAAFRRAVTLHPAANVSIEINHSYRIGHYAELRGDLRRGQNYTLSLRGGLTSRDGTARLDTDIERVVAIPDAPPSIRVGMPGRYLSPHGSLHLPLESVNVETYTLRASRIPTHNLVQYAMREGRHYRHFFGQPNHGIHTTTISRDFTVQTERNAVASHSAPLRELLPEDPRGAYVIELELDDKNVGHRLLVISDIGIIAKLSADELFVWANSIHTLEAVTSATVKAWSSAGELLAEGRSDRNGLSRLAMQAGEENRPFMITVENGADLSFLDITAAALPSLSPDVARDYLGDGYEAFLYTDRGVYRPGETAHVRAIVRGPPLTMPDAFPVDLEILRPDGRPHSRRSALLSKSGTVEFAVPWADFDGTGRYLLSLKLPGSDDALGTTAVAVEEFAPPLIAAAAETCSHHYNTGETGRLSVSAHYLYGAPAAGNPAAARFIVYPVAFTSPHYPDHTFGDPEKSMAETSRELGKRNLDSDGQGVFSFHIPDTWQPPAMLRGLLAASVSDQGGRAVTAHAGCDIHAYPLYIGLLRKGANALRPGDDLVVDVALVNTDGTPLTAERQLAVELYSVHWKTVMIQDANERWRYSSERELQHVQSHPKPTQEGQAEVSLRLGTGGRYMLRVQDPETGASSSLTFFVGRESDHWQTHSMERPGRLQLELNKEHYQPGETAQLSVVSPFPGKALLTVEQDRVVYSDVQTLESNSGVFEIPISADLWPNAHVNVTLIRAVEPAAMQQVYRAIGSVPLRLDSSGQRLQVQIDAPDEIRPASRLKTEIRITDPDGQGRSAEFTLAAIDEGICALTDFKTPDPLAFFSALRRNSNVHADLYAMLLAEMENELVSQRSHTGGDMANLLRGRLNPVRSRRFKPLALWHGAAMTDADGRARVALDIPEFTGQVRLMVVAVDGPYFGHGQAHVQVRRPVTILPSLPRFLAPGDTCLLTIDVHNSTGDEAVVDLDISTSGPVKVDLQNASPIRVEAGERVQKQYAVQALNAAGTAKITFRATVGGELYEETIEVPVRPPAPRATLHAVGMVPAGEQRELKLPEEWLEGSESFSLLLSERPTAKLKGALDFLVQYPYGCLEQTVSAAFPLLYLEDLQELFHDNLQIIDLSHMVAAGVEQILSMQLNDGSFGYWPNTRNTYEWGTAYALHFLVEARASGYAVPRENIESGLNVLRRFLSRPVADAGDVGSAEWRADAALRAYACRVLAQAGHPRHDWAARLLEQADFMDVDSRLQLVLALTEGGRRRDAWNELQITDRLPLDPERRTGDSIASPARTAALRLTAMAELAPDDPRTLAAMQQLESLANQGYWHTTQENAMAFVAFARYMRHSPNSEQGYRGWFKRDGQKTPFSSDDTHALHSLQRGGTVTVFNKGPAALYTAWKAAGIPLSPLPESAEGIRITRAFLDLDGEPMEERRVTQGDLLTVRLSVDTKGKRIDNLVIEELLPAGLEIENPNLRTSQPKQAKNKRTDIPVRHVDTRDDRLIVFADAFSGMRTFEYTVRAVSPGTFTLPHATVEAMYDPAITARSGAGTFEVEPW